MENKVLAVIKTKFKPMLRVKINAEFRSHRGQDVAQVEGYRLAFSTFAHRTRFPVVPLRLLHQLSASCSPVSYSLISTEMRLYNIKDRGLCNGPG